MKIRYIVLLMFGSIAITAGAFAFGYYVGQDKAQKVAEQNETNKSNSNSTTNSNSGGSGLSVLGAGNSDDQLGLPTPDNFNVYQQYLDGEAALIQEIEEGQGQQVEAGDTVAMLYTGWLTNGEIFDQSRTNEAGELEPFVFTLGSGQVIRGWEQGIVGMKIGGKRRLVIPPAVGYGDNKQGSIPANSLLVFDVELVQAQKQQQPQSGL